MDQAHQEPFPVVQTPQEPSLSESSMSKIILSKEVEDSSSTFQASQAKYPNERSRRFFQNVSSIILIKGSRRLFLNSSSTSSIIPMEWAEDPSPVDPSTPKQIPSEEAEDSSLKYL